MKEKLLWRIAVATGGAAEEAVAELLAAIFDLPVSSYTDVETGAVTVSVYLTHLADWSAANRRELAAGLAHIAANDLPLSPGKVTCQRIPRRDWANSWKLHFKPRLIGRKVLLRPSWSRRRPRRAQVEVVLDPGLSFGTGRHPTTSFCLEQLVVRRKHSDASLSCLDVGTGSGILAIAAAKLGYGPVDAFDLDPESISVARANARRNRVSARIAFRRQDLTRLSLRSRKQYSVVCANLIANLLLAERDRLLARLHPQGVLLLAGILKTEFSRVRKAYERAGLRLIACRSENEWKSGAFTFTRV